MGLSDLFKRKSTQREETLAEAQARVIEKTTDEKQKAIINEAMRTSTGQAWLAKSILCIIYAYIGDVRTEIFKKNVSTIKGKFDYKDGTYFLILGKDKVKIRKAPWYSLGVQWIANLEYEEGNPIPLSHSKSDIKADAYGMNRVISKASRDTLLPSSDSMLMFICALCLIGMLVMMGLAGYLLTDPNGAANIKGAFTPKARQPAPAPGAGN